LPKLQGGLFAAGVEYWGELVGVGIAGNPARKWQGTGRFVISRVAVVEVEPMLNGHTAPLCSMLYGALCRAGKALGYQEAWTYTLDSEAGVSLRAAGFEYMGESRGARGFENRPGRVTIEPGPKGRWRRVLTGRSK
jgi:hypothetical protein